MGKLTHFLGKAAGIRRCRLDCCIRVPLIPRRVFAVFAVAGLVWFVCVDLGIALGAIVEIRFAIVT